MHVLYVLCSPLLFASEHFTFPRGTRLPGRSSAPFQAFFHHWGDHLTSLGLGSLSLRAAHAVARRPSTECWFSSRLSQLDAWRLRARTEEAFMMSESNQELCMFRKSAQALLQSNQQALLHVSTELLHAPLLGSSTLQASKSAISPL